MKFYSRPLLSVGVLAALVLALLGPVASQPLSKCGANNSAPPVPDREGPTASDTAPPTSTTTSVTDSSASTTSSVAAAPSSEPNNGSASGDVTIDVLKRSLSASANGECKAAQQNKEQCRTPEQLLGPVNACFKQYGLTTIGQKAAILSILDFESEGFHYATNLNPDNHGQGTFSQMKFPNINKYVKSIPELQSKYQALTSGVSDIDSDTPSNTEVMDKVLALVTEDDTLNVCSASWYLSSSPECGATALKNLESDSQSAYETYLTQCIHTTVTDGRIAGWKHTLAGLRGL
ncbi:hypothetical protein IWQ60_002625 [Tieghemiomyces parasiticus]|uniref:Uncharacterized protein n=1 Tax=Tieghemiomyces parasiticus TaxID=78921 RepID=A0A9W8ABY2_9FUNG|nr:hypothetical protein IWQ60_002625 [Tieghemiomyces parasiticus]